MKAYCPQCGQWTDDDWTEGPFGRCCWPCEYAYRKVGAMVQSDEVLFSQLGRMLGRAYAEGVNGAQRRREPLTPGRTVHH